MSQYRFKINGTEYEVAVNSVSGNIADVTVNGTSYQVELQDAPEQPVRTPAAPAAKTVRSVTAQPSTVSVPKANAAGKAVTSPLPGVILAIKVNVGDVVKCGQTVAVLEAMKMENDIQAEYDGTVTSVNVTVGDSVLEGEALVSIS